MSRPRFAAIGAAGAGLVLAIAFAFAISPAMTPAPPAPAAPERAAPAGGVGAPASGAGAQASGTGMAMGRDVKHDTSPALRTIKGTPARPRPVSEGEEEDNASGSGRAPVKGADTVVQTSTPTSLAPSTGLNFEGIGFPGVNCNCAPPDTNGEVGDTQFVQSVNDGFQVFDKATGSSLYGPVTIGSVWTGFGGVCETSGDGDPVVLWDQLAHRWLLSQFAGSRIPTDECIAVSQTADATGAWYRYDFKLGSNFYDYPHLAVWPDGYYMSDNVFNSAGTSYLGPQAFVFDRAKMLNGQAATFQTPGPLGSAIDPILPADIEGDTLPPSGAPAVFVRWPGAGAYQTYHWQVDWTTPANSSWSTFASPAAASFTQLCATTRSCVPQLNSTANLDALADRLMFRLTYRNVGDHESVVGSYTVSSGGVAGVRWFELRGVTSGPETVYQQSTYQPDTTWRWMPSAAMDASGGIAVGFNASSASIYPQLRYAGRNAGDPIGQLTQGEGTLVAGTGSQTGTSNRWGDYADLTVDPVDGCTFWFTGEYYTTTASFSWHTRIGTFKLSGCGSAATTGSIAGHVTDAANGTAIAGATVTIQGGGTATTDSSGAYSFGGLAPADYTLSAAKAGYTASASKVVTVTAGTTSTADFTLAAIPTYTTAAAYAGTSAAGTGGDNNGYETNRSNLWGSTAGTYASDVNSGTAKSTSCTSPGRDREVTSGYGVTFTNPVTAIRGITVQLRGYVSAAQNSPQFCVQLSRDGGTTWTTGKTVAAKSAATTFTLGSAGDLWGLGWTAADFGSSFRLRVTDLANSTARTFYLDWLSVQVTYQ